MRMMKNDTTRQRASSWNYLGYRFMKLLKLKSFHIFVVKIPSGYRPRELQITEVVLEGPVSDSTAFRLMFPARFGPLFSKRAILSVCYAAYLYARRGRLCIAGKTGLWMYKMSKAVYSRGVVRGTGL